MDFILDTHVAIWALENDKKLSKEAKEIINDIIIAKIFNLFFIIYFSFLVNYMLPQNFLFVNYFCVKKG